MDSMQHTCAEDGSLSASSLTAHTGAGKTVILAAVTEGLFYGMKFLQVIIVLIYFMADMKYY